MSSTLYWRPPPTNDEALGYEIKRVLQDYFDGSISQWSMLNAHDVGFLKGVIAGSGPKSEAGKDAQTLLDMIGKHGHVEIREVF